MRADVALPPAIGAVRCLARSLVEPCLDHRFTSQTATGPRALVLAARCAPELCETIALEAERARGRPGAGRTHGCAQQARGRHHRFSRTSGLPRAMCDGVLRALPGAPGFLATIAHDACASARDTSVGVSEPHGLTVRHSASRLRASAPDTATAIAPRLHAS
jgi:hypothetical protein